MSESPENETIYLDSSDDDEADADASTTPTTPARPVPTPATGATSVRSDKAMEQELLEAAKQSILHHLEEFNDTVKGKMGGAMKGQNDQPSAAGKKDERVHGDEDDDDEIEVLSEILPTRPSPQAKYVPIRLPQELKARVLSAVRKGSVSSKIDLDQDFLGQMLKGQGSNTRIANCALVVAPTATGPGPSVASASAEAKGGHGPGRRMLSPPSSHHDNKKRPDTTDTTAVPPNGAKNSVKMSKVKTKATASAKPFSSLSNGQSDLHSQSSPSCHSTPGASDLVDPVKPANPEQCFTLAPTPVKADKTSLSDKLTPTPIGPSNSQASTSSKLLSNKPTPIIPAKKALLNQTQSREYRSFQEAFEREMLKRDQQAEDMEVCNSFATTTSPVPAATSVVAPATPVAPVPRQVAKKSASLVPSNSPYAEQLLWQTESLHRQFFQSLGLKCETGGEVALFLPVSTFADVFDHFSVRPELLMSSGGFGSNHFFFSNWSVSHVSLQVAECLLEAAPNSVLQQCVADLRERRKCVIRLKDFKKQEDEEAPNKQKKEETEASEMDQQEFVKVFGLFSTEKAEDLRSKRRSGRQRVLRNSRASTDEAAARVLGPNKRDLNAKGKKESPPSAVNKSAPRKWPRKKGSVAFCSGKLKPRFRSLQHFNNVACKGAMFELPPTSPPRTSSPQPVPTVCKTTSEPTPTPTPTPRSNCLRGARASKAGVTPAVSGAAAVMTLPSGTTLTRQQPSPRPSTLPPSQTAISPVAVGPFPPMPNLYPVLPDLAQMPDGIYTEKVILLKQTREMEKKRVHVPEGWCIRGNLRQCQKKYDFTYISPEGRRLSNLHAAWDYHNRSISAPAPTPTSTLPAAEVRDATEIPGEGMKIKPKLSNKAKETPVSTSMPTRPVKSVKVGKSAPSSVGFPSKTVTTMAAALAASSKVANNKGVVVSRRISTAVRKFPSIPPSLATSLKRPADGGPGPSSSATATAKATAPQPAMSKKRKRSTNAECDTGTPVVCTPASFDLSAVKSPYPAAVEGWFSTKVRILQGLVDKKVDKKSSPASKNKKKSLAKGKGKAFGAAVLLTATSKKAKKSSLGGSVSVQNSLPVASASTSDQMANNSKQQPGDGNSTTANATGKVPRVVHSEGLDVILDLAAYRERLQAASLAAMEIANGTEQSPLDGGGATGHVNGVASSSSSVAMAEAAAKRIGHYCNQALKNNASAETTVPPGYYVKIDAKGQKVYFCGKTGKLFT